jgi:large subunit ribosomal protein L5
MADENNKVEEGQEPSADKVELVAEAKKAKAEAVEALPKAEKAETPKPEKVAGKAAKTPANYTPRLKADYEERIVKAMTDKFGYKNRLEVPRLDKIVINMGVGDAIKDGRMLDAALEDLTTITGQKPVITKARKSIAGFKLREGMSIGAKVTLRGDYMWEFLDRLLSIALPRIRDFRGLPPTAFDGHGNYTIGVTEQLIFPEIDYDKVVKVRGMDITVVTTAQTDDEGRALLLALGFPLQGAPAVSQAS